jgi:NTE family protein
VCGRPHSLIFNKKQNLSLSPCKAAVRTACYLGRARRLLEEEHIAIRGISVTSVGAVNAPIMADGYGRGGLDAAKAELHRFWESVSQYGAISPYHWSAVGFGWSPLALWFDVSSLLSAYKINTFNIYPLRTVLAKTTDSERLRCCASVKLYISATNTNTNRLCVFTAPELSIETLLASICLPQLRQAMEINGDYYWDGGYMGNPVLETLVRFCKSNDIIIVQINPNRRDGLLSTAPQFGERVNEITFDASLLRELRSMAFITQLVEPGEIKDPHI